MKKDKNQNSKLENLHEEVFGMMSTNAYFFGDDSVYKDKIISLGESGEQLFKSLIYSGISKTVIQRLLDSLLYVKETESEFYEDKDWVYSVLNKIISDKEFAQSFGFSPDILKKFNKSNAFHDAFPGLVADER